MIVDTPLLETLRLLTNLTRSAEPTFTLLIVGQSGLLPALDRMPAFEERLAVKCLLRPLNVDETAAYVSHRLSAAGARHEIFTHDALTHLGQLAAAIRGGSTACATWPCSSVLPKSSARSGPSSSTSSPTSWCTSRPTLRGLSRQAAPAAWGLSPWICPLLSARPAVLPRGPGGTPAKGRGSQRPVFRAPGGRGTVPRNSASLRCCGTVPDGDYNGSRRRAILCCWGGAAMLLGYNTNGFAHHDPAAALELLAEIGYRSVALTLDHGLLNPFAPRPGGRHRSDSASFSSGCRSARSSKPAPDICSTHGPSTSRRSFRPQPRPAAGGSTFFAGRSTLPRRWAPIACRSGRAWCATSAPSAVAWSRLTEGLAEVLQHAERRGVVIGFEPEPGMLVDTMASFGQLREWLPSERLMLTLDVGHLHCQGELPIGRWIADYGPSIVNVHIEDMRAGVHEHLVFGEGEIDFPPIIAALAKAGFEGGLHVELSRHSHAAVETARQAYAFLEPLVAAVGRRSAHR